MRALEVSNLSYVYPDGHKALTGISFMAEKGTKVFFHGANGAGKTTLFQCLNGLLKISKGVIKIHGKEVKKEKERMKAISLVFQNANDQIIAGSVFDEVAFGPLNLGLPGDEVISRTEWAMEVMNVGHLRDRPPHFLSYGQKKRVAIASILSMNRDIIILDEPTAGLDSRQNEELVSILNGLAADGVTLLISTHDAEFSFRCADRVIALDSGRLVCEGSPEKVFSETPALKKPIIMEVYEILAAKGLVPDTGAIPRDIAGFAEIFASKPGAGG